VSKVREIVCVGLVALLSVGVVPSAGSAAQQAPSSTATLRGAALRNDLGPMANATVQVRSLETGQIVASTPSGGSGEFSFTGLTPGNYLVELVDASGGIVGTTAPLSLAAGASAVVPVVAGAAGAAAAMGSGVSLLGLGPAASIAALAAAGAAAITAVISTRPDASPSR
jgi:hypothetical protein